LVDLDQPELVLMGLDPVAAHSAVSWVADERRAGRPVPLGEPFLLERSAMKALTAIKVLDVPDEWVRADLDRMATWFAHFGTGASSLPVPSVQQVVWADRAGRFPDDPRCADAVVREQPILRDAPLHHPVRAAGPRERHRRR
jgi:hypothetical protein